MFHSCHAFLDRQKDTLVESASEEEHRGRLLTTNVRQISQSLSQTQNRTYFEPQKCGRKCLTTEDENKDACSGIDLVRNATKVSVKSIVSGIVARKRQQDGFEPSMSWVKRFLHDQGYKVRATQTDRTVTDEEVIQGANEFYGVLKSVAATKKVEKQWTFNMDEFFCSLSSCGSGWKWTWHRADDERAVAVRQCKLGFTCSVLSNAAGEIVLLQTIWKGLTAQVHAAGTHQKIYQDHRPDSHFQNGDTFNRWVQRFLVVLENKPQDVTAVLIIDQAEQHKCETLSNAGVCCVAVPKKQTHIFQPADQFIIAGIKAGTTAAWNKWVQQLFTANDVEEAVKHLQISTLSSLRSQKFSFLGQAIDKISLEQVTRSWQITGILKALFDEGEDGDYINSAQYEGVPSIEEVQPIMLDHKSMMPILDEIQPAEAPADVQEKKIGRPKRLRDEDIVVDWIFHSKNIIRPLGRPTKR
eukprot:PhF_6_TR44116/c1_g2_i4/m.67323